MTFEETALLVGRHWRLAKENNAASSTVTPTLAVYWLPVLYVKQLTEAPTVIPQAQLLLHHNCFHPHAKSNNPQTYTKSYTSTPTVTPTTSVPTTSAPSMKHCLSNGVASPY
jgi:hypothetical protein